MMFVASACAIVEPPQFDCECDELLTLAETIDWVPGQELTGVFGTREEGLPVQVDIAFQDLDEPDTAGQRLNDAFSNIATPTRGGPEFGARVGGVGTLISTGDSHLSIRLLFGDDHDTPTEVAVEALQPLVELFGTRD